MLDMKMNPGTLMAIGIFLSLVGLFLTWHGLAARRRWARRDGMGEFSEAGGRSGEGASDREMQISALQAELNQVLRTRHNLVLGVRSVIEAAGTGREVDRDSRMQLRSIGEALPYVLSGRRDWQSEWPDDAHRFRGRMEAHCKKHGFALPGDPAEATSALLSLAAYLLQPSFAVPIEGLRSRYPVKGWDLRAYELGAWQVPANNGSGTGEELGAARSNQAATAAGDTQPGGNGGAAIDVENARYVIWRGGLPGKKTCSYQEALDFLVEGCGIKGEGMLSLILMFGMKFHIDGEEMHFERDVENIDGAALECLRREHVRAMIKELLDKGLWLTIEGDNRVTLFRSRDQAAIDAALNGSTFPRILLYRKEQGDAGERWIYVNSVQIGL